MLVFAFAVLMPINGILVAWMSLKAYKDTAQPQNDRVRILCAGSIAAAGRLTFGLALIAAFLDHLYPWLLLVGALLMTPPPLIAERILRRIQARQ